MGQDRLISCRSPALGLSLSFHCIVSGSWLCIMLMAVKRELRYVGEPWASSEILIFQ